MFNHQKKSHPIRFFFIPLALAAAALLMGWAVMYLWNTILPTVTGFGALTYWQAVGLLVLCRLLFGGFRWGAGRPHPGKYAHWRNKWAGMSEEEKARFREAWSERCRHRSS